MYVHYLIAGYAHPDNKNFSQENLEDFKKWFRDEGNVFVVPNDPDFILQVNEDGKIEDVHKDCVLDPLTLSWNHRCALGSNRNRVEVNLLILLTLICNAHS